MADADLLFQWANEARPWSKSTHPISREEHDRWMMLNVWTAYPAHVVIIAESDYGSVGVVRFDMVGNDVMTYRVSITIGSEHRGKGYGTAALDQACGLMADSRLLAEVRSSNAASRAIFEKCGFTEIDASSTFIKYRRDPLCI